MRQTVDSGLVRKELLDIYSQQAALIQSTNKNSSNGGQTREQWTNEDLEAANINVTPLGKRLESVLNSEIKELKEEKSGL
jgi:hypothetical protein